MSKGKQIEKSNFTHRRDHLTDKRIKAIEEILNRLKEYKVSFKNKTALSEYVADQLSDREVGKVWSSTIRRNIKYCSLLIEYLNEVCPEALNNKVDTFISEQLNSRRISKALAEKDKKILELENRLLESDKLLKKRLTLEYAEQYSLHLATSDTFIRSNDETEKRLFSFLYEAIRKLESAGMVETMVDQGVVYDWEQSKPFVTSKELPKFFEWLGEQL